MDIEAKYTRVEYERRFLVDTDSGWKNLVEPYSKRFEDKYISGTRLRLRTLTDSDTGRRLIKLTKKNESPSPYFRTISRILLSPDEHKILDVLEGHRLRKVRYYHNYLDRVFSIDVFEGELGGLVLCETESDNLEDLMSIEPPPFVRREVTDDSFFDGGNLCRTLRKDLMAKLGELEETDR
jgi:CYTH domain-containing protein